MKHFQNRGFRTFSLRVTFWVFDAHMALYEIQSRAYAKVISHACKHPFTAVNGVLLGRTEERKVVVQDAIPLFHTHLNLAPMLEAALMQVMVETLSLSLSLSLSFFLSLCLSVFPSVCVSVWTVNRRF